MKTRLLLTTLTAAVLSFYATGCDYDDDDDFDDHDVPEGKGSIIVDNNSADDIAVYIDGVRVEDVDDYEDEAYDVDPGLRRVVLDQRGGEDRSYRGDIDVIEGKRTVLDVSVDALDDEYDVEVFFD